MNENILLVEDEEALRMTLGDRLRSEGYSVDFAADGREGYEKAIASSFDLIILDIMLPRLSGLEVCRGMRLAGNATPILLLTARGQSEDKIVGLNIGADDYITKPFDTLELIARIEALLRRSRNRPVRSLHRFGSIVVDFTGTSVTRDGIPIPLSAREFELLRYLIERKGTTVSREQILRDVWDYEPGTQTRTVDVHVASLRQKLEDSPKKPIWIATVPGLGYKFQG